jgi:hypothetical protein
MSVKSENRKAPSGSKKELVLLLGGRLVDRVALGQGSSRATAVYLAAIEAAMV